MISDHEIVTGPSESGEARWKLRFFADVTFENIGILTTPPPRIGEKVCFLRHGGVHTETVRDVVHHVYPNGYVDVIVYVDRPLGPGTTLLQVLQDSLNRASEKADGEKP